MKKKILLISLLIFCIIVTMNKINANEEFDIQKRMKDINKLVKQNPKDAVLYMVRAGYKEEIQDNQGALEDYNKAIELNPKNAEYYCTRGTIKAHLEQYKDAIKDYDKAIDIKSDYAEAYTNRDLVKVLLQNKNKTEVK